MIWYQGIEMTELYIDKSPEVKELLEGDKEQAETEGMCRSFTRKLGIWCHQAA